MAAAYFLSYVQIPRQLLRKKYPQFSISLFLSIYITCTLYATYRAFYFEGAYPGYFKMASDRTYLLYIDVIKYLMYASALYTPAVVMAVIKLTRTQYEEQQKRQLLEKEKLQAELSFLKNQLNPHFLFNTLNNLYMLTLKASPQAPEVVAKLAATLDYMLYRCHERTVPLKGEIELIENYLMLEKLRFNSDVSVKFSHANGVGSKSIAPLIMLSLVENAFKHGVNKSNSQSTVDISLTLDDNTIRFSVGNSKNGMHNGVSSGIGLKNIRRQLELIYPGNHRLAIDDRETFYSVELTIDLH